VRRDTPPAGDVLAALDEPAQRVPLGMFLLRAPRATREGTHSPVAPEFPPALNRGMVWLLAGS
jgi:hypothetical protein